MSDTIGILHSKRVRTNIFPKTIPSLNIFRSIMYSYRHQAELANSATVLLLFSLAEFPACRQSYEAVPKRLQVIVTTGS